MNDETLFPCPFCGSKEGFIERYDYSSCYWQCEGCLARGPLKVIEDGDEEIPGHDPAMLAWNTRAQASAPEGGEAVAWKVVIEGCDPQFVSDPQFFKNLDGANVRYTKEPLFTRSNAKAGEVEGQMLPKGWNIEVRTANGRHALCVFGPDGCFAVHGDTDHKSDIRAEVIDQLRIALSTHDKTKA